jgi:hypothetical protein
VGLVRKSFFKYDNFSFLPNIYDNSIATKKAALSIYHAYDMPIFFKKQKNKNYEEFQQIFKNIRGNFKNPSKSSDNTTEYLDVCRNIEKSDDTGVGVLRKVKIYNFINYTDAKITKSITQNFKTLLTKTSNFVVGWLKI